MRIFIFAISLMASTGFADENLTVIHAGTLLAIPGEVAQETQSITVRNGVIEAISSGFIDLPEGANLIDLRDQYVLPGLIDMHVHLLLEASPEAQKRAMTES